MESTLQEPVPRFPFPVGGLGPLPRPPEHRMNLAIAGLAGLFEAVVAIDDQLVHIAHLLDRSQPSAEGKLSVRFRRARGKTVEGQKPVFVRWSRPPGSRAWKAKVLASTGILRKAKVDGLFRPTRDVVRDLLIEARSLMVRRASLLRLVDVAQRSMSLNAGLARKQVCASSELYLRLEPEIEATRAQAPSSYYEDKAR